MRKCDGLKTEEKISLQSENALGRLQRKKQKERTL